MEGIKIEIGERERRRRGGDVSRNVSPPTTTTANGRRGRLRCCTHTRHQREIESEIFSHCCVQRGGRKENLPSDRRAHYSSMTKWRWKNKKNKREDGHMCTYNLFTHLPTISAGRIKKMDDPTGSLTVTASFYIRKKKKKSFSSL